MMWLVRRIFGILRFLRAPRKPQARGRQAAIRTASQLVMDWQIKPPHPRPKGLLFGRAQRCKNYHFINFRFFSSVSSATWGVSALLSSVFCCAAAQLGPRFQYA